MYSVNNAMAISVNVTISMPPEMVERIEEQADTLGMSRAGYMRHLAKQAPDSPFECPDTVLCQDENGELNENVEGAA